MAMPLEPINEEAQQWFRAQWDEIEQQYADQIEELSRLKEMFMGLATNAPPKFLFPMQEPEMYVSYHACFARHRRLALVFCAFAKQAPQRRVTLQQVLHAAVAGQASA